MSTVVKSTPLALIDSVVHLLSLPSVYNRLEETLKDPFHDSNDIAKIVSVDPALCARVLRVVNSSYYALPNQVHSISMAAGLIGEYDLRNMVLLTSVVNSVDALVDDGIDIQTFWRHSIRCGLIARLIAKQLTIKDSEFMFIGGLLHDLGHLVIYKNEKELFNTVGWHVENSDKKRFEVEQDLLGFDHALIGALLVKHWGLSEKLSKVIRYHHQVKAAPQFVVETQLIDLADQLTHFIALNSLEAGIDSDAFPQSINYYLKELSISTEALSDLLHVAIEQSQAIEEIII